MSDVEERVVRNGLARHGLRAERVDEGWAVFDGERRIATCTTPDVLALTLTLGNIKHAASRKAIDQMGHLFRSGRWPAEAA